MSTISASTTSTTAYKVTADTTGTLVFQTGSTPTTAMTLGSDQSVTFAGAQTYTGAATFTSGITVQGITVGKGAGAVSFNTVVGSGALAANSTGNAVTAVGYGALAVNTVNYNTAVGRLALTATSTGVSNTGVGAQVLSSNTLGAYNTALGQDALYSNTIASGNTAVGYQAGYTNQSGTYNTFVGYQAGYTSAVSNAQAGNTCVGTQAGYSLTTGTNNTFVGPTASNAGYYVTSGSKNTILGGYNGNQGGLDIRTSSNYVVLSDGDGNPRGVFDSSGRWNVGQTGIANQDYLGGYGLSGISTGYAISGETTINTIKDGAGYGGSICVIRGYVGASGVSYCRIYAVATRVGGGSTSSTGGTLIGSAGASAPSFTFGVSGGYVTVTSASVSSGYCVISFFGL